MKKLILLFVIGILSACMKIQKKSDIDVQPEPTVQTETVLTEPVIFTLNEALILTDDLAILADEVHLKSDARIFTNQFNLSIKASRIFIDRGAFIQSFHDSFQIAKMTQTGLSGGIVQITGHDIHGNLQVFMNSQIGGPGLGGWGEPPRFCQPDSGKDSGQSGSFFLTVNNSQDFTISTSMNIAPGGPIGNIWKGSFLFLSNSEDYKIKDQSRCADIPSNGKPGFPGQICLKLSENILARCESY